MPLRPKPVGSIVYVAMGASATPGAQALGTVPAAATAAVIFFDITGYPSPNSFTNLTTNLGTIVQDFTLAQVASAMGQRVVVVKITNRSSGRTITPTYASANNFSGAGMHCVWLEDADPNLIHVDFKTAQSPDGTANATTANTTTRADGTVLVRENFGSPSAADYPALGATFTNLATNESTGGTIGYRTCTRLKRLTTPADSSTYTATTSHSGTPGAGAQAMVVLSLRGARRTKWWDGTGWRYGSLKRWTGSAWVAHTLKRWTGSTWQE